MDPAIMWVVAVAVFGNDSYSSYSSNSDMVHCENDYTLVSATEIISMDNSLKLCTYKFVFI